MKRKYFLLFALSLFFSFIVPLSAQNAEVDPHDLGRMWTFEDPPVEWFSEAYDFEPGQAWFDHVRKSSLRFASWCSGSFVSPDGLIMTNHHCSRGVTLQVEQLDEDFAKEGFYASTREEERRVPGLFVEQLIQAVDISSTVDRMYEDGMSRKEVFKKLEKEYQEKPGWENLRIQLVSYYSGARHSIYGYKRFEDIRLVLVPETQIGFYGGEEDNFTYPRYNLDFTFWRAYDKNGEPVNSSAHYMPFNPGGPENGEPVFVIGNPARTERYKTVAQLEYDRDYRYPMMIDFYSEMYDNLKANFENDPNPGTQNQIFGLSNSLKVFRGITRGLNNTELMDRKKAIEQKLRNSVENEQPWLDMESHMDKMKYNFWAMNLLRVGPTKGASFMLMHQLAKYEKQLKENADMSDLEATRMEIRETAGQVGDKEDKESLLKLLARVEQYIPEENKTFSRLKNGATNEAYIAYLFEKSKFYSEKGLNKMLDLKAEKFLKKEDPLQLASRELISAYEKATAIFTEITPMIEDIEKQIAKNAFEVFGDDRLSPDATFTLRISDGVVKGYEYNGTRAPYQTTFYGLYDRYYSHEGASSWDLPEKWMNPEPELLKTPINFVSTNDIIGGNSGSPIINRNAEVVGLIFDGNIESLPGNFIYDNEFNRAVSVHTAGMLAAIKYVYKADRLYMELMDKK